MNIVAELLPHWKWFLEPPCKWDLLSQTALVGKSGPVETLDFIAIFGTKGPQGLFDGWVHMPNLPASFYGLNLTCSPVVNCFTDVCFLATRLSST